MRRGTRSIRVVRQNTEQTSTNRVVQLTMRRTRAGRRAVGFRRLVRVGRRDIRQGCRVGVGDRLINVGAGRRPRIEGNPTLAQVLEASARVHVGLVVSRDTRGALEKSIRLEILLVDCLR